jgi:hypothetical protein
VPEAKLTEVLSKLAKKDFLRQFMQAAETPAKEPPAPPWQSPVVTGSDDDLDFTSLISSKPTNKAEDAATSDTRSPARELDTRRRLGEGPVDPSPGLPCLLQVVQPGGDLLHQ